MRKPRPSLAVALAAAIPVGAAVGVADVLYFPGVWLMIAAQAVAAFCIVWFLPSRWISVGFTLTVMVWLAYAWARVPWWEHPDEVDAQAYSAGLAAMAAFAGALAAGRIQSARGKI